MNAKTLLFPEPFRRRVGGRVVWGGLRLQTFLQSRSPCDPKAHATVGTDSVWKVCACSCSFSCFYYDDREVTHPRNVTGLAVPQPCVPSLLQGIYRRHPVLTHVGPHITRGWVLGAQLAYKDVSSVFEFLLWIKVFIRRDPSESMHIILGCFTICASLFQVSAAHCLNVLPNLSCSHLPGTG